jgi:predicted RNase H-like HicB family nuclease
MRREEGEWVGHALEYPEAIGVGKTVQKCMEKTRKTLLAGIASMLEDGETPPLPARQNVRSEQVNLRLTPEEKALLESRSRARGFRGIADFVRTSVLAEK